MTDDRESQLTGGNVSSVFRVGDTVRRNTGEWTPSVHTLLRYLEGAGFDGAPRVLGIDDRGREILSFLSGSVFTYPMPAFVWSEHCLVSAARLLRKYHDVVRHFEPPPDAVWRTLPGGPTKGEVICHNDAALYNTVFRAEEPVALIDWDLASPGPRLWDMAYTAWFNVPLVDDASLDPTMQGKRLRLFCDAYGLEDRSTVLSTIRWRQQVLYDTVKVWAEAGVPAFVTMWEGGHADHATRSMAYLDKHWRQFARALEP